MTFAVDFSTSRGLGRPSDTIPYMDGTQLLASQYAAFVLYNPAIMAVKTSILVLYLRISKDTRLFLSWAATITLVLVNIAGIAMTFLTIFRCSPIQASYAPVIDSRCISLETLYLTAAPVNVVTDLAILILPIPVLTALKLPWRQRFILVLTFLLGAFTLFIDIVRIYQIQLATIGVDPASISETDIAASLEFSYNISLALLWSVLEVNIGITCACIPTLRPLAQRIFPQPVFYRTRNSRMLSTILTSCNPIRHHRQRGLDMGSGSESLENAERVRIIERAHSLGANSESISTSHPSTDHHPQGSSSPARLKSMLYLKDSVSLKYCAIVSITYALVEFAVSLLLVLNRQIPVNVNGKGSGLPSMSYGGRILGPILGIWILHKAGFKATFVTGLGIYCIGALIFWPSGYLRSYPGFMISNFVVGFGLASVMMATYGFVTLCGPPYHAEFRVCLFSAVWQVASVLGGVFRKYLFANVVDTRNFIAVEWTYIASVISTTIFALCFYYIPLPEATDSDLQDPGGQATRDTSLQDIVLSPPSLSFNFGHGSFSYVSFNWRMGMRCCVNR